MLPNEELYKYFRTIDNPVEAIRGIKILASVMYELELKFQKWEKRKNENNRISK